MFRNDLLAGRCALITGASSGLGVHFAGTLANYGATVVLAARRLDALTAVAEAIRAKGGTAIPLAMDVCDPQSVHAALREAAGLAVPLTIVVNNAGIAVSKPLLEQTEADWSSVVDTNLTGAWRVAQGASRLMVEHGQGGSIINIASILGLRVAGHVPAYASAKAGLVQLTKAMAFELARHRIRVNAIAPGYIETELNKAFFASESGKALLKRVPQRRIGKPEDLDGVLLLLASEASAFMTGAVVAVDGGHLVSTL